ncbi:hypothetical protein [Methylobacterium sp. ID0610]|uniref:hypothetical protein n=1 Tax=Methylobacterium carpenticola TaxID=3344827 RepID=UPI003690E755
MSTRRLDDSYGAFRVQIGAHGYAKQAALRKTVSVELLTQLGLGEIIGTMSADRRKTLLEHFERVGRQIRRQGFVDLVSSFEADLFRSLRMATSQARHILNEHYGTGYPFAAHRQDLTRTTDDFSNLGGYRRLLAASSASAIDPRRDVWDVVSYRDFLAHGERWSAPAAPPTVEAAYRILSAELDRIEAVRT